MFRSVMSSYVLLIRASTIWYLALTSKERWREIIKSSKWCNFAILFTVPLCHTFCGIHLFDVDWNKYDIIRGYLVASFSQFHYLSSDSHWQCLAATFFFELRIATLAIPTVRLSVRQSVTHCDTWYIFNMVIFNSIHYLKYFQYDWI